MSYNEKVKTVKNAYSKKRKKYKLPKLVDIQNEFLIPLDSLSGEENVVLTSLRGVIGGFMVNLFRDIEFLLSGAPNYCCYFERRHYNKKDKLRLFNLYRKVQEKVWKGKIAHMGGEKETAEWIKEAYKFWKKEARKEVSWYYKKMHKIWEHLKPSDAELKYVG